MPNFYGLVTKVRVTLRGSADSAAAHSNQPIGYRHSQRVANPEFNSAPHIADRGSAVVFTALPTANPDQDPDEQTGGHIRRPDPLRHLPPSGEAGQVGRVELDGFTRHGSEWPGFEHCTCRGKLPAPTQLVTRQAVVTLSSKA